MLKNKYRNTLLVNSSREESCSVCSYLVVIVAEDNTDSSVVLAGQNVPISIRNSDRSLFDQFPTNEGKTLINYHIKPEGQMIVHTYSGKIRVTLTYK